MNYELAFVHWNVSPEIFSLGSLTVRWYGLLFAAGFFLGYHHVERMFRLEKIDLKWLDSLLIYLLVATIVGARLGHVFFYAWDDYSQNPAEIFKVWKGGLASHGGSIGVILALYLWSRRVSRKPLLWILDRVAVPTALVSALIRTGNLMNSEIYGVETTLPWGFIFERARETVAKHPTQIYEALAYLVTYALLMYMYWKTDAKNRQGLLVGVFLVMIFLSRFLIEFVKEIQEPFEAAMTLNMGQLLSIPFVIAGFYLMFYHKRKPAARKK